MQEDNVSILSRHDAANAECSMQHESVVRRNTAPGPSSSGFVFLLLAYRSSGGMLNGEDLGQILTAYRRPEDASLATLIATRALFCFTWRSVVWVPMFQFDLRDLTINAKCRSIFLELEKSFDDWGAANWMAQPNCYLNEKKPIDLLESDFHAVLDAAGSEKCHATRTPFA